jgi:protein-tyrosine phosphatase
MTPELNLSWIDGSLAVGGRFPMEAAAHLAQRLGISRVVDLRDECCDDEEVLRRHGIVLLKLPTRDMYAVSQPMLDDGARWVCEQLDRGHRVYIHCEHGIGRSVLLALCVLALRGTGPLDALEQVKTARWQASPSQHQLEGFREFLRRRTSHRVPPLDALCAISWRHLRASGSG